MNKLFLPIVACVLAACGSDKQQALRYDVIPLPQEINLLQESPFKLTRNTVIAYPEGNALLGHNADFLADYIEQATGFRPRTKAVKNGENADKAITLGLDPSVTGEEGYRIITHSESISICGKTANGVFYGIQTLRKSIPAQAQDAAILLPAGEVEDWPRFSYRGMHLDVGRHFFPVEFIKEFIDLLALHNMNTLHWHLTEDQGWRIEIKKYPKLTEIGSVRQRTVIGHNSGEYDNTPYEGFYTQEEAREIVEYAQKRYVTIIPEIDLPGHMLAALAAYPELGCTGGPYKVCPNWGVFEDVLCIGNEKTIPFLEDIMTEIIDIFPSKYIHIGGDEAPRTRWQKCSKCQALIRKEGLKADKQHTAEDRLQSYCTARIEKFLNERERQIIGWDEILEGDLAPNATVMSWRGSAGGIKAAQMGHDVIMTPNTYCYFDYFQSEDTKNEPYDAIGGYIPVEKVYSFDPVEGLDEIQQKYVLGVQANVWTEYMTSPEQVEYMVLPRMAALAEVQWTQPGKKEYNNFLQRLGQLAKFYDRDGLNYAKHVFKPMAESETKTE
ncbi:beta-N-acetylhexosaminidase [Bacteroides ndongoniae]|uniref:beta-N-acetylhexosaminidase n=1 Tax=Bacteroides ndongoniae TaxID=1903262 RepID=UPI0023F9483C|nr:beta-N-acetylhexosaminidase [Bacteroides ndongoniae]